ncbi:hypothetical protein Tco_0765009 [Tanacetum coccineum]
MDDQQKPTTTENTNNNQKPKYYYAIDETIHTIQALGISKFGEELGLEESEVLDEVEFWLREKEKSYTDELRDFFKQESNSSRQVIVDENILFQLLSLIQLTKALYDPELAKSEKLDRSMQRNMIEDYKVFIKSVEAMVNEGREKLKEKNKQKE